MLLPVVAALCPVASAWSDRWPVIHPVTLTQAHRFCELCAAAQVTPRIEHTARGDAYSIARHAGDFRAAAAALHIDQAIAPGE